MDFPTSLISAFFLSPYCQSALPEIGTIHFFARDRKYSDLF